MRTITVKLDLYDYKQVESMSKLLSEKLSVAKEVIENDLLNLTKELENYKDEQLRKAKEKTQIAIPPSTIQACTAFLQQNNLLNNINELIGKAGVVGEENSRLLLFIIASSYKMRDTLHAIVQGSSGSGKTTQIKVIANFMPDEDVKRFTRVTESSFYNYGEYDLQNKLIVLEDADGLEEKALLAFRELQSNEILISSSSQKQDNGHDYRSGERTVRGPIASLSATTKGEYYEDNMGRCFVISIDESKAQTKNVINYQNQKAAGLINDKEEKQAIDLLKNCVRLLQPLEVINPYANKIHLPEEVHQRRRLNQLFQSIVKQITLLNQYQRQKDKQGRLITEREDIKAAIEILFESIILKVDELDGSLRQFYEQLKMFTEQKAKEENKLITDIDFNRFEVMQYTGIKKTQQHIYINKLIALEYIQQYGFANRGFKYKIAHWDNMKNLREKIQQYLNDQIEQLV
jgi:energy-coupling factor transporter ATP-binding protein EcfA2